MKHSAHHQPLLAARKHVGVILLILVVALVVLVGGYLVVRPSHASGVTGDVNNDGTVNILDLSELLSKWGTNYAPTDLNGDGTVNIFDLSIVLNNWGKTAPSPSPSPSPTSSGSATPQPAAFPSTLHQCGRKLCDANNYALPPMKSFNVQYPWSQTDFNDMYAKGARMVRVLVIWTKLEHTAGTLDMTYVTSKIDPIMKEAVAAGLYVQPEMTFNAPVDWPSWAGTRNMTDFMNVGQMPTQFIANRYGNTSSPEYTRAAVGMGIDEPLEDDWHANDHWPHLEAQHRQFITWMRAKAPSWMGIVMGDATPIYNDACAAEQGKQSTTITNASETAYDSVGNNVIWDIHDEYEGSSQATLNFDSRNFYGYGQEYNAGGTAVKTLDSTPSQYPSPYTAFQDRASLLTQLKGFLCTSVEYSQKYDGGKGMPLEIGEFGWRVGSSTTTLEAGTGYAAFLADQMSAFATGSPVIVQQWDYSHNQGGGQDPFAAKPVINGSSVWQPFDLNWFTSTP